MKKTNQKGITLVALIITIIVMLILVGVSVNIALDGGLFKAAQSGAKQIESERKAEENISTGQVTIDGITYSSIEDYAAGVGGIPTDLKVGDYVTYKPDTNAGTIASTRAISIASTTSKSYSVDGDLSGTGKTQTFTEDTNLKWRVLSIDDGKITLIADKSTSETLTLKGAIGWNNSIDILNNICKNLYSAEGIGEARSVAVEDINKITEYSNRNTYNSSTTTRLPIALLKENGYTDFTDSEITNRMGL